MIETVIEFIGENITILLMGIGVIITNLLGKPKTAEKLKKAKEKRLTKVKEKITKTLKTLKELNIENESLEKELNNEQ